MTSRKQPQKQYLIDTNYFLRLLIADVPEQFRSAQKLFREIEEGRAIGWVSLLVINELFWVLEHFYQQKRSLFVPQLIKLLALKNIKVLEVKKAKLITVLEATLKKKLDLTDWYLLFWAREEKLVLASFDKELQSYFKAKN